MDKQIIGWAKDRVGMFFPGSTNGTGETGDLTGQCVSLVKWYLAELTNVSNPHSARGHAMHFGDALVSEGWADRVGDVRVGDIIVWPYDGGGYGHIGVYVGNGQVFEENVGLPGRQVAYYYGSTVYSAGIDPLYASWRIGGFNAYRIKGKFFKGGRGASAGGEPPVGVIGGDAAWKARIRQIKYGLTGEQLWDDEFDALVGREIGAVIMSWAQNPISENWVNALKRKPVVGNDGAWRDRMNTIKQYLLGENVSNDEWLKMIGKNSWAIIEDWSRSDQARKINDIQYIGSRAQTENWQGQIIELQKKLDEQNKTPRTEDSAGSKLLLRLKLLLEEFSK